MPLRSYGPLKLKVKQLIQSRPPGNTRSILTSAGGQVNSTRNKETPLSETKRPHGQRTVQAPLPRVDFTRPYLRSPACLPEGGGSGGGSGGCRGLSVGGGGGGGGGDAHLASAGPARGRRGHHARPPPAASSSIDQGAAGRGRTRNLTRRRHRRSRRLATGAGCRPADASGG